jgi:hypothetical protein
MSPNCFWEFFTFLYILLVCLTHVALIFLQVTSTIRSIHNTPYINNCKKKKEPRDQNYPGNTARFILNQDDLRATQYSLKIAIRKARAWCRANSKVVDQKYLSLLLRVPFIWHLNKMTEGWHYSFIDGICMWWVGMVTDVVYLRLRRIFYQTQFANIVTQEQIWYF